MKLLTFLAGATLALALFNSSSQACPTAQTVQPTEISDRRVTTLTVQPGRYVQNAFDGKAQVELLRVARIPGRPNVVNVQTRLHLLHPNRILGSELWRMSSTTAQNSISRETYKPLEGEYTDSVMLVLMQSSSVDAHVLMAIPEGVDTIDLYINDTGAFLNVPIAN